MASGRFFEACDCLRVASETSQLAKSGRFMPSWPADAALSHVTATQTLAAQPEGPVTAPKHLKTISVAQNEDASRPCKQEKHLPSLADAEQLSACERSGQRLIYYMWVQPFCRSMSFTGRCSQGGPDVSRRGHLALRLGGRGQVRGPDAGLGRQQLHGLAGPLAPRHSTTCGGRVCGAEVQGESAAAELERLGAGRPCGHAAGADESPSYAPVLHGLAAPLRPAAGRPRSLSEAI